MDLEEILQDRIFEFNVCAPYVLDNKSIKETVKIYRKRINVVQKEEGQFLSKESMFSYKITDLEALIHLIRLDKVSYKEKDIIFLLNEMQKVILEAKKIYE